MVHFKIQIEKSQKQRYWYFKELLTIYPNIIIYTNCSDEMNVDIGPDDGDTSKIMPVSSEVVTTLSGFNEGDNHEAIE